MNILNQLNHLLSSEGEEDFNRLYSKMLQNRLVREAGVSPTKEQWREYLELIKTGCEYIFKKFGPEGIPSKLKFYDDGTEFDLGNQFICYAPDEDEFAISYPYAVEQILKFNTNERRGRCRFPNKEDASIRDYVILQAVEECFHRYQVQTKGQPNNYIPHDHNQPMEKEATGIMLQAAKDLNIPLKADLKRKRMV